MKERLKMIFDRIDIFVVCIVFGLCFCIVEAFLGIWDVFAYCFVITLLATEVCYTLRLLQLLLCLYQLYLKLLVAAESVATLYIKDADASI